MTYIPGRTTLAVGHVPAQIVVTYNPIWIHAPHSLLWGIKTQNLQPSKQLHVDVLTMELLIRLFAALLLDILAYDFFIAMTPYSTDKVAFGPKFTAP